MTFTPISRKRSDGATSRLRLAYDRPCGYVGRMRFRPVYEGALCLGAVLAVVGGCSIGVLHLVNPEIPLLPRLESGYQHVIFAFMFLTLFAAGGALLHALAGEREPAPDPSSPPPPPKESEKKVKPSDLAARYHEMKTYVDLEMWELALEKANAILSEHPGSKEAEIISKNINELHWKAEPKFVTQEKPLSANQQKQLREKGLAQMYQHVKTYVDLEMWELARQKAITIMTNFPESPEAAELTKLYPKIDRKARDAESVAKPEAGAAEKSA